MKLAEQIKINLKFDTLYVSSSKKLNFNILKSLIGEKIYIGEIKETMGIGLRFFFPEEKYDLAGYNLGYKHELNAHNNLDNYLYEVILKKPLESNSKTRYINIEQIKSLKFIRSEEQYDLYRKKKDNKIIYDKIYPEDFAALENYMQALKDDIDKKHFKYFEKFKTNKTIILYKGIYSLSGYGGNHYTKNKKVKLNNNYTLNFKKASSWTTNYAVAFNFASSKVNLDGIGFIIKAYIKPKEIIIDTRLLPQKYLVKLYQANQREVILKPGKYTGKIIKIIKKQRII